MCLRVLILLALTPALFAQLAAAVEVHILDQVAAKVSPLLYGLMTEEINYSFDGGLYAELIRNRSFKEDPKEPAHWNLIQENGGTGAISLDPNGLKLTVNAGSKTQRVGIANDGFWGIPVRPSTRYQASVYAKSSPGFNAPLTVSIVSDNGGAVLATAQISRVSEAWQRYQVSLTATNATPSAQNHFVISTNQPGTIWFGMVSLFPPTYKNRANGNRQDLMQLLADMKPAFLRFPGGNWSSDGMGLLEFLHWCEDLQMRPVLAVYAGYLMHQERVKPGPDLAPYVRDALDEIEYVTGSPTSTWGARCAKDGHPAPFELQYVEIGNEDNFDRELGSYDGRFAQFYDAIKSKYPALQIIATSKVMSRTPDVIDEHYYRRSEDEMASSEWATRGGEPTPNMTAALGDAAWMTGMERNSDLVIMSCYAPLFVNINKDAMQWKIDLIGYDATSSYGSPAYYAQEIFSRNHGDEVLISTTEKIPLRAGTQQPVHVNIESSAPLNSRGQITTLAAKSPDDTNSIDEPRKIIPVTSTVEGLGKDFVRIFPPYSISVLQIKRK